MKILVTGFDPFGGESINPAIEVVKELDEEILGATIIKLEIPTVCYKSLQVIEEAIKRYDPDVILSIGQAGGRSDITVERIGININDFSIRDNEGQQIIDEKIYEDGPDAYFVNIPIKAVVEKIRLSKIPASVSNTAGTFVCNHVIYGVRHLIETKYNGKKSGFIHIPYLPEQVIEKKGVSSMSLDVIVQGEAIKAIIENEIDIKTIGGAIH